MWKAMAMGAYVPLDHAEAAAAEDEQVGAHVLHGLADGLLGVALHHRRRGARLLLPAHVQRAGHRPPGVLLLRPPHGVQRRRRGVGQACFGTHQVCQPSEPRAGTGRSVSARRD